MPLKRTTFHKTPCGLKKTISRELSQAYHRHCETQCEDAIQPFCMGEPHARACQRYHLREGWQAIPGTPAAEIVLGPLPLLNQRSLWF
jgi:hypothetical protein